MRLVWEARLLIIDDGVNGSFYFILPVFLF